MGYNKCTKYTCSGFHSNQDELKSKYTRMFCVLYGNFKVLFSLRWAIKNNKQQKKN